MATQTPTIDSQVHAYERNRPERPWIGYLQGPDEVTGDDMTAAMDAVGVDGALLVSPFSMYRYDPAYVLEVYAKHPGRFGLIKPFDPQSEAVADEVAEWAGTPGVVGARIMLTAQEFEADDPGINRILASGAQAGFPVNVMCSGKLPLFLELARRHPDTQMVVDHVGIAQPSEPPAPPEPFADLANVVSLAACDNVSIKISGACTLSHQPFPYPDIWEYLRQVFDAFGFERCMWGTDWTRAVGVLSYEQGVEAFRVTDQLSDSERSALMGGTLAKIYNWSPN
ncbi:MAG: amidohydrolase [Dehalococcoidia bacterium]|jgi:predicted TIM-barrel fold metal-dependent hydrolase|nr:amidohydrolase [Dehalococcoidia bacterium]